MKRAQETHMYLVKSTTLVSSLFIFATVLSSSAKADDFVNSSFEDPYIGDATLVHVSGNEVTGWNMTGSGDLISNGYDGAGSGTTWNSTTAGYQYLYMQDYAYGGYVVSQNVNLAVGENTLSFLQADFASDCIYSTPGGAVDVEIFNPDGSVAVAPTLFTTPAYSSFIQQSLTFAAATAGSYEFDFISVAGSAGNIDDVHVQPAPEPISTAILIGALGTAIGRRRRKA